jgi:hypothetical protein
MRKREIRKYAGMWIIKLLPADAIDFNLEEGDEIDIEQMPMINNTNKKRRKLKTEK